jgi:hypothetical protein
LSVLPSGIRGGRSPFRSRTGEDTRPYQKAVGYSYDTVKIFLPAGPSKPTIVPYVEHVPPDTTAAIFWLKNRDSAHWRDAWQIEASVGKYIISDKPITAEQWIRERALLVDGEAKDVTPKDLASGERSGGDGSPQPPRAPRRTNNH